MEDPQTHARFLNPWVLHLQKLGLELKCPFCLNLYDKPMLLPCNHIFCRCCVPESSLFGSDCPICKVPYVEQELREAPYMVNLVNIYRSLEASFSMHMLNSDIGRGLMQCSFPSKANLNGQINSSSPGNSASGTTIVPPRGNERAVMPNSTSLMATLEKCSGFPNLGLKPGVLDQNFEGNITSYSQARAAQQGQHNAIDVMNQMELSPDSPPSSGASKGAEIDSSDPGKKSDTAVKCLSKKLNKRAVDDSGTRGTCEHPDSYSKKQKQTNLSLAELPQVHSLSMVKLQMPVSSGSATAKCGSNTGERLIIESESTCVPKFICAFCQTWKVTEGSGPLLHFDNGKQVFGSEAARSNITHLHESCIEWTPQIYYENDTTIRNVEKELARAEKLKCTSCGLKGAALGCFAKSCRRTYHAPCAYEIEECRWDTVDFLMLCPAHASQKFPCERSKKSTAKKPAPSKIQDELKKRNLCESDCWTASPSGAQNWVLCASSLSADQKSMLGKFANLCGATVTKHWTPEVTHVIAATDANGACSRTLKVLMGILKGRWILKPDWVKACMELGRPVDEEAYEINLDNHGCCDGPRIGRLRALSNGPMLFSGLKFFFSGDFESAYLWNLQDLIVAGGGGILTNREQLERCSNTEFKSEPTMIVYNDDEVTGTEDASNVLQRQLAAEMVAAESRSQVIPHTWLLASIASNKLQPVV